MNKRDFTRAEKKFRKVLQSDRSHVPALNLLSVVLTSLGRFADAEQFVARAVELNQSSDVSFYNYGLISKELNKPQQAYEKFTESLKLNPNVPETWNNRGAVCNDLKEYELALSDFDRAASLNGAYAEAYANRGNSLMLLKRYDEAVALITRRCRSSLVWPKHGSGEAMLPPHSASTRTDLSPMTKSYLSNQN